MYRENCSKLSLVSHCFDTGDIPYFHNHRRLPNANRYPYGEHKKVTSLFRWLKIFQRPLRTNGQNTQVLLAPYMRVPRDRAVKHTKMRVVVDSQEAQPLRKCFATICKRYWQLHVSFGHSAYKLEQPVYRVDHKSARAMLCGGKQKSEISKQVLIFAYNTSVRAQPIRYEKRTDRSPLFLAKWLR